MTIAHEPGTIIDNGTIQNRDGGAKENTNQSHRRLQRVIFDGLYQIYKQKFYLSHILSVSAFVIANEKTNFRYMTEY